MGFVLSNGYSQYDRLQVTKQTTVIISSEIYHPRETKMNYNTLHSTNTAQCRHTRNTDLSNYGASDVDIRPLCHYGSPDDWAMTRSHGGSERTSRYRSSLPMRMGEASRRATSDWCERFIAVDGDRLPARASTTSVASRYIASLWRARVRPRFVSTEHCQRPGHLPSRRRRRRRRWPSPLTAPAPRAPHPRPRLLHSRPPPSPTPSPWHRSVGDRFAETAARLAALIASRCATRPYEARPWGMHYDNTHACRRVLHTHDAQISICIRWYDMGRILNAHPAGSAGVCLKRRRHCDAKGVASPGATSADSSSFIGWAAPTSGAGDVPPGVDSLSPLDMLICEIQREHIRHRRTHACSVQMIWCTLIVVINFFRAKFVDNEYCELVGRSPYK